MRKNNCWRGRTRELAARIVGLAVLVPASCVDATVSQAVQDKAADEPLEPFVDPATLDPNIPTPESVIGHAVGRTAVLLITCLAKAGLPE